MIRFLHLAFSRCSFFILAIFLILVSFPAPTLFAATPTPISGAAQAIVTAEVLNVRAAPNATATIVGRLNKGAVVQILARTSDNAWWQIAFPDSANRAWIAAQYTQLLDPMGGVPIFGAATATRPATRSTSTPTSTFTATLTPSPTATSTLVGTPTATATSTATRTPTVTSTPTPTPLPTHTPTPTPTGTPTLTPTITPTFTPSPTPTPTQQGHNPSAASIKYNTETMIRRFSTIWYRFEYLGDRSPISVVLEGYGVQDLELHIFAPDQVDPQTNTVRGTPIGRGSVNRTQAGHAMIWNGSSPQSGTFYIAVINKTDRTIIYRLNVTGPAVTASAITAPELGIGSNIADFPRVRVEVSTPTLRVAVPIDYKIALESLGILLPKLDQVAQTSYEILYPPELSMPPLVLSISKAPDQCTPPDQVGEVVTRTIKLCPNSVYWNLNIAGADIGVFGDEAGTAVIKSEGRSFAVTAVGERLTLQGLKIQASTDPLDANIWLCQYEKCGDGPKASPGSTVYGGGILLKASNSLVSDVTVRGGVSGLAILDGSDNYIVNNRFLYQTGWSSYNRSLQRTQFMGNAFHYANRSCKSPTGKGFFTSGCETAGWLCIDCKDILLVDNECRAGGNCYYVNGDGGVPSYNVKFFRNACYGSPHNCFEVTFSKNVWFEKNTAARDITIGWECNYPFWVGGSEIIWGRDNNWACMVSADRAKARSEGSVENR